MQRRDDRRLFSDGAEGAFRGDGSGGHDEFVHAIQKYRHLPIEEMMLELTGQFDTQTGSLHPEDDITVLAMEVGK
jgi:hypothetical protein